MHLFLDALVCLDWLLWHHLPWSTNWLLNHFWGLQKGSICLETAHLEYWTLGGGLSPISLPGLVSQLPCSCTPYRFLVAVCGLKRPKRVLSIQHSMPNKGSLQQGWIKIFSLIHCALNFLVGPCPYWLSTHSATRLPLISIYPASRLEAECPQG